MRLRRLVVTRFKGIRHAELTFGPTLNVVAGPNDLGKSTLATAIHAALLVPSRASTPFHSWHAAEDELPGVVLELELEGRFWRVEKSFGARGTAALESSKDGHSWTKEASAREVEERLRALLSWGVRAPGGAGAARGLPNSFLANALLAPQDKVDDILRMSLEADNDPSGRVRLTGALAALAQDPVARKLLDAAQKEADRFYTATGRRRSGADSPFKSVSENIKELGQEREQLADAMARSAEVERQANELRTRRVEAAMAVDEATAQLARLKADFERARQRSEALTALTRAKEEVARLESLRRGLLALKGQKADLAAQAEQLDAEVMAAGERVTHARERVTQAQQAVREAELQSGAEARAARRTVLDAEVSTAQAHLERLEARFARGEEARTLAAQTDEAQRLLTQFEAALAQCEQEVQRAVALVAQRQTEEGLAEHLQAFALWREALQKHKKSAEDREEAQQLRTSALAKEIEARQLEARASEEAQRVRALPNDAQRRGFAQLERDLAVARGQLSGPFRVAVRPNSALSLRAAVDEKPSVDEAKVIGERTWDAERRVLLSIGNLVDIEVTSGSAERRAEVEALQRRWTAEVVPVLQGLGVTSLGELEQLSSEEAARQQTMRGWRDEAAAVRTANQAALQRAEWLEQQAAGAPTTEQVAMREAAIGSADRNSLQAILTSLGANWEKPINELATGARAATKVAQEALTAARTKFDQTTWRRGEVERQLADLRTRSAAFEDVVAVTKAELAEARDTVTRANTALAALTQEASAAVDAAQRAHEETKAALSRCEHAVQLLDARRSEAKARVASAVGEEKALRAQVDALDTPRVEAHLRATQAAFDAVKDLKVVEKADVDRAESQLASHRATLEQLSAEFHGADGRLTSIAGPVVRDRWREVEQALATAHRREQDLEVEAESWKLLREALREAENQQGAHLGRALSKTVGARFSALTGGRYGEVTMATTLVTSGVALEGAQVAPGDVLEGLSVGTRDQLATLIRLAIAQELGSVLVLDDQLVHSDPQRLDWFRRALLQSVERAQVVVITCRGQDYEGLGATVLDAAKVISR